MQTEEIPNADNNYNSVLKISSEEDLLVEDEVTGVKLYTPVTTTDVGQFKREAEHLYKEIQHAKDEFRWNAGKHKGLTCYYHIYLNLAEQLTDFLKYIHTLHKKVYISIYKSYDDEFMEIYTDVLEKVLQEIQTIAQKHSEYLLDEEEDYGQIPSAKAIYEQCKKLNVPAGGDFPQFDSHYRNFVSMGLKMALAETISTVTAICADFLALYRTRLFRTDHEAVIIYHYIKRIYDENTLPGHLEHVAKVQKRHLRERRIDITTLSLQKVMNDIEGKYNNYKLCSDWFNNVDDEEDEEELVRMFVREQASPEDFVTLFKYQGERKMLVVEIAKADEYERHGDSFFVNWVDPAKLKEKLEFWLKGNIRKQQDWYIVWCLMKFTFHMVKEGKDKSAFAARMNLLFPEVEKRCVVESFRKQETQMNHNRPFDEWLADSDPDYHIALELYYKLEKREEFMRSFGV